MTNNHPLISVKTITDYHLESFIRCPYKFYYHHILSLNDGELKWRQVVQYVINQVVQNYYQLPLIEQNPLNVFTLFDRYWKHVSYELFESKKHYYMVLAKITDHLLQFLTAKQNPAPPLFLYEKLNTYVKELETKLSLTFELAEWSTNLFTIKKYLVEADEELIKLYHHLIVVFSNEAFGNLPDRIEIITLLEGEKYTYTPTRNDITQGIKYLKKMKSLLLQPDGYIKTDSFRECMSCPYTQQCRDNRNSTVQIDSQTEDFLH
ncbi:hypothetical protein [Rossellomorea sp. BNER]|uniref:hypothetical protein n=1 Tax=Rossellomorea sp. BNER TaxID=2962031 RepID=UPI003AF21386|nr:hypothetical protein [Rossellomorea sp. BNER]